MYTVYTAMWKTRLLSLGFDRVEFNIQDSVRYEWKRVKGNKEELGT